MEKLKNIFEWVKENWNNLRTLLIIIVYVFLLSWVLRRDMNGNPIPKALFIIVLLPMIYLFIVNIGMWIYTIYGFLKIFILWLYHKLIQKM